VYYSTEHYASWAWEIFLKGGLLGTMQKMYCSLRNTLGKIEGKDPFQILKYS
jgi:hypothetical protein